MLQGPMKADDWIEAAKIVITNAKRNPINEAIMPLVGAGIIFALWYYDIVSWPTIKMFLCYDLC